MKRPFQHRRLSAVLALLFLVSAPGGAGEQSFLPDMLRFANPSGAAATFSTAGKVDLTGPFFQSLGTNGRACVSCHQPATGFTVTPAFLKKLFDRCEHDADDDPAWHGVDDALLEVSCAIFRTNDGSNSPNADVSTL